MLEKVNNAILSVLLQKILGIVNELESLKPVVQQQIATGNSRGADEPNGVYGTYAASSELEHHTPGPYVSKVCTSLSYIFPP